jgi:hypothetical protein
LMLLGWESSEQIESTAGAGSLTKEEILRPIILSSSNLST